METPSEAPLLEQNTWMMEIGEHLKGANHSHLAKMHEHTSAPHCFSAQRC